MSEILFYTLAACLPGVLFGGLMGIFSYAEQPHKVTAIKCLGVTFICFLIGLKQETLTSLDLLIAHLLMSLVGATVGCAFILFFISYWKKRSRADIPVISPNDAHS